MEWYEIQTAYEVSHKIFSTGPKTKSPQTDYFLLETLDNISDFFVRYFLIQKKVWIHQKKQLGKD